MGSDNIQIRENLNHPVDLVRGAVVMEPQPAGIGMEHHRHAQLRRLPQHWHQAQVVRIHMQVGGVDFQTGEAILLYGGF